MNGGEGIEEGWRRAGRWDETASETTMEIRVLHAAGRGETRNTRARALTGLEGGGGWRGVERETRDDSEV